MPLAPAVIVIQLTLLAAVHAHPVAVVTLALPVPPDASALNVSGDTVTVHGAENVNVLDRALALEPPGPTAATSDSYIVPGSGHPTRTLVKSTVIVFVASGAGFPRFEV